jgi:hypothetical protein
MYYLRNRVSHEYFGVDYEIIWDVATNYLPENKIQIDQIIDKEKYYPTPRENGLFLYNQWDTKEFVNGFKITIFSIRET